MAVTKFFKEHVVRELKIAGAVHQPLELLVIIEFLAKITTQ